MMPQGLDLSRFAERVRTTDVTPVVGRISDVVGLIVEVTGVTAAAGDRLTVQRSDGLLEMEVLGFRKGRILAAPLGSTTGLRAGDPVSLKSEGASVAVGDALLGRVLDSFGNPLDDLPLPDCEERVLLHREPPQAFTRRSINTRLETGIRVLDGMLPLGRGQRVGLFAGTGVGKSTLLAMICRRAQADVVVIGLVGERGREVRHFVEHGLGKEGLQRAIVVAATSDQPPLVRAQGALRATAIAEYFRDRGKNVLLLMDSVTRYAMAMREATLACGEPPVTKGYTPSVFAAMPRLFERAGNQAGEGSITAIYTVLVEGDDMNDPIADAARGALDGHIVLSRNIAERGHYPAVDVLASVTRVLQDITDRKHRQAVAQIRDLLGSYRDASDLLKIGAYVQGSDPRVDLAISQMPAIEQFLTQDLDDSPTGGSIEQLCSIAGINP